MVQQGFLASHCLLILCGFRADFASFTSKILLISRLLPHSVFIQDEVMRTFQRPPLVVS